MVKLLKREISISLLSAIISLYTLIAYHYPLFKLVTESVEGGINSVIITGGLAILMLATNFMIGYIFLYLFRGVGRWIIAISLIADAVSLYFNLRSIDAAKIEQGETYNLEMVIEDTVKVLKYRLIGREVCRVPQMGKFRTIKLACTLGTSEGFSFTDGSEFFIWITDDRNKFPVLLESPIIVGSIRAYISDFKGLKYPLDSKIR